MHSEFYKAGQTLAQRLLGLIGNQGRGGGGNAQEGSAFPEKRIPTAAELLARRIGDESPDDVVALVSPDNTDQVGRLDRPASWGSPSQIDANQPNGSMMLPGNVTA